MLDFRIYIIFTVTNCAPVLTDVFLYSYLAEFIQLLMRSNKEKTAKSFSFTFRFIIDAL